MTLVEDRIRRFTPAPMLRRVDEVTDRKVAKVAQEPSRGAERIAELDREWDMDRVLEAEAAGMGLLGLAVGTIYDRRFYALTGAASGFMLLQALTGLYPMIPLFRGAGVRTAREIERERYALKAVRGDFGGDAQTPALPSESSTKPNEGSVFRVPDTAARVTEHTAPEVNERIKAEANREVARLEHAGEPAQSRRVVELEREWDVERTLQANAGTLAFAGTVLGMSVDRRWLCVPAVVFSFLLQHSVQGYCPPLPVLRRLGKRTVKEIERERFAIKALRGDFEQVPAHRADPSERVRSVLTAVDL